MIREIEKQDYLVVAQLLKDVFKEKPWDEDWTIENAICRVEELMDCQNGKGFVFLWENEIVGGLLGRIVTYVNKKEMFIDEFFISPRHQGLKIGSKMLNYIKENLTMVDNIVLMTERGFPSQFFYEKNGFVCKDSSLFMYYKRSNT